MMKRNESDAGHRIAVTQNGNADALAPADVPLRAGDAIHTATALEDGRDGNLDQRSSSARGGRPFRPRRARRAQCLNGLLQLDSLRGARLARHMCIDPQRDELIREELGRIVASDLFCRSDRLCRFLRFSVEQALRGESDRVKEYVVAVEAYGRPASFDSRVD